MKLKIDRKAFAQALSEVAPFAPQKAPIVILKNAKFTTKGNRMKIEANDTQNSMVKYVTLNECDADGSFLMDIAELNKFTGRLPDGELTIEVDNGLFRVTHPRGSAEFTVSDVAEYPIFKMPENEVTEISLPASLLADVIAKGKGFVASDTLRPIMNAIYVYIKDGTFGYCASDTHKLIHGRQAYDAPESTDVHWLIMPSVFVPLLNLCKSNDNVTVKITATHASYRIGSNIIQTVLAKGIYPNFSRVIPQTWNMECAVDKADLTEALGRVSLFCDASECVKMNVSRMDMTLSVDNLDHGKKSNENLPHNGCDGEITIGVNGGYLLASIGVFTQGEILLRMTDASRPILIAQMDNEGVQTLAMPMTIVNG